MRQAPESHWDRLGAGFPSVKGAASTAYYRACEERLFRDFFPALPGRSLLKTDLWDEAKNTEILEWAARQGVHPLGIDVALATVRAAARVLDGHRPAFVVADVRAIPFRAASCDLGYSMGTIEHVPDPDRAIAEMFRVLRPGGTAIIGVPNAPGSVPAAAARPRPQSAGPVPLRSGAVVHPSRAPASPRGRRLPGDARPRACCSSPAGSGCWTSGVTRGDRGWRG